MSKRWVVTEERIREIDGYDGEYKAIREMHDRVADLMRDGWMVLEWNVQQRHVVLCSDPMTFGSGESGYMIVKVKEEDLCS